MTSALRRWPPPAVGTMQVLSHAHGPRTSVVHISLGLEEHHAPPSAVLASRRSSRLLQSHATASPSSSRAPSPAVDQQDGLGICGKMAYVHGSKSAASPRSRSKSMAVCSAPTRPSEDRARMSTYRNWSPRSPGHAGALSSAASAMLTPRSTEPALFGTDGPAPATLASTSSAGPGGEGPPLELPLGAGADAQSLHVLHSVDNTVDKLTADRLRSEQLRAKLHNTARALGAFIGGARRPTVRYGQADDSAGGNEVPCGASAEQRARTSWEWHIAVTRRATERGSTVRLKDAEAADDSEGEDGDARGPQGGAIAGAGGTARGPQDGAIAGAGGTARSIASTAGIGGANAGSEDAGASESAAISRLLLEAKVGKEATHAGQTRGTSVRAGSRSSRASSRPSIASSAASSKGSKRRSSKRKKSKQSKRASESDSESDEDHSISDELLDDFLVELFMEYSLLWDTQGRPLLNNPGLRRFFEAFMKGRASEVLASADICYAEEIQRQEDLHFTFDLKKVDAKKGLCFRAFLIVLGKLLPGGRSRKIARRHFMDFHGSAALMREALSGNLHAC